MNTIFLELPLPFAVRSVSLGTKKQTNVRTQEAKTVNKEEDLQQYLIERCLKSDSKAQYQLYKLYADAMFNVAMRIMNDYETARDTLQDAFVDAFTKLHTFRGDASFGSWLKRIVINRCIGEIQKKKLITVEAEERKLKHIAEEEIDESYIDYGIKQIQNAMPKLPEGLRVVLNLYLFEGYDHAEIGEILGVTESTSKAQYSKARKRLRELLNVTV